MGNRYIIRSVKYFIWLSVLFAALMALMIFTGTARGGAEGTINEIFHTSRGLIIGSLILLLAIFYPKFSFVKREINADIDGNREEILSAMRVSDYIVSEQQPGRIVFRAASPMKRAKLLWEDKVVVSSMGQGRIKMEGIRREAVRMELRIISNIRNRLDL